MQSKTPTPSPTTRMPTEDDKAIRMQGEAEAVRLRNQGGRGSNLEIGGRMGDTSAAPTRANPGGVQSIG